VGALGGGGDHRALAARAGGDGGAAANALLAGSPCWRWPLIPLVLNWSYASRAGDYAARDWAYNLLNSVEPYGVLFTNGDNDTFPLWYLQEVEGIRRDVTVIVWSYLNTPWYAKQIRDLTTPCERPGRRARTHPHHLPARVRPRTAPALYAAMATARRSTVLPLTDAEIDRRHADRRVQLPQDVDLRGPGDPRRSRPARFLPAADQFILTSSGTPGATGRSTSRPPPTRTGTWGWTATWRGRGSPTSW
jgi:hypothetical protein